MRSATFRNIALGILALSAAHLLGVPHAGAQGAWVPPDFIAQWPAPEPFSIAVDGSALVYVANAGVNRVQQFTANGTLVRQWSSLTCRAIAVDSHHDIYVTDLVNDAVNKFSPEGALLATWPVPSHPGGLAVGFDDTIYVVSQHTDEVLAFTRDGALARRWGGTGVTLGKFVRPTAVACDRNGEVYVFDSGNGRVQVFNGAGQFNRMWYLSWSDAGSEVGMHASADGDIYLPQVTANVIWVYDRDGNVRGQWGAGDQTFRSPYDVADDAAGHFYVADLANQRVQKFGPQPTDAKSKTWGRIKALYR